MAEFWSPKPRRVGSSKWMPTGGMSVLMTTAQRWTIERWQEGAAWLPCAAIVLTACLLFQVIKLTGLFEGRDPALHGALLAMLVMALAFVRARDVARPLRILHRSLLLLFTGFIAISYPTLSEAYYVDSGWTRALMQEGRWVAVALGLVGWWRPGFALVPALYVAWKKEHLADLYGFKLNATDYYIVMELTIFVCLAIGLVALVERLGTRSVRSGRSDRPQWSLGEGVFMTALASKGPRNRPTGL